MILHVNSVEPFLLIVFENKNTYIIQWCSKYKFEPIQNSQAQ